MNSNKDFAKEVNEAIDSITKQLAQMPREQRLKYFEGQLKPMDTDFVKKIYDIHYVVRAHFDREKQEDMRSKVKRLVLKES